MSTEAAALTPETTGLAGMLLDLAHVLAASEARSSERQLVLLDAVRRLAAVAQQPSTSLSSVQIEQAAKGPPRVTVKIYHADPQVAADEARRLYAELTQQYAENTAREGA